MKKIFKGQAFELTLSSMLSYFVDVVIFWILNQIIGNYFYGGHGGLLTLLVCAVGARLIADTVNFTINRNLIFKTHGHFKRNFTKFLCIAIPKLCLSFAFTYLTTYRVEASTSNSITLIKIIVDLVLFIIAILLQKFWVFREKKEDNCD